MSFFIIKLMHLFQCLGMQEHRSEYHSSIHYTFILNIDEHVVKLLYQVQVAYT